jgi:hypothetical protein
MMASTTRVEQKKLMLKISDTVYSQVRKHGEETYPHECCGVLLGKALEGTNEVEEAIRAGNTRTDSAHNRYHIAPQELVSIQRQARERRPGYRGLLPLPSRPSCALVADRFQRSPLAGLLLRDHQRRNGSGRTDQLVFSGRHRAKTTSGLKTRDSGVSRRFT